jgi:hypothetical protein
MKKAYKIVVFVPETHTDQVRLALGEAGAGKIGNYTFCTFTSKGFGQFKPEEGAHPAIGEVGTLETVAEERIEVTCDMDILETVVSAIKEAHPYEEVPIDIYTIELT